MTTLMFVVLPVLAVIFGIACFAIIRRRSAQAEFLHFRCPGCKQRLRYQAGKAGRSMICPQCYHRSKLPMAG